jgi:hypothetical protein
MIKSIVSLTALALLLSPISCNEDEEERRVKHGEKFN